MNPEADKEAIIFNENNINWDSNIYLAEGATDHIVTPNSIPLLGKFISEKLLYTLHDNANGLIIIVFDGDDDAYKDAVRLYGELGFGDLTGRIRIVRLPFDDPSKIVEDHGVKKYVEFLGAARKLSNSEFG